MSAERLRRVAADMCEKAEAATPGPWSLSQNWLELGVPDNSQDLRGEPEGYLGVVHMHYTNKGANGDHIAAWHPAVALAVADWLDSVGRAERHEVNGADIANALAVCDAWEGQR